MAVRVRFAPSPTGFLHVGSARTALFNWLFARQRGGDFILRIEDTDRSRSSEELVAGILEGLQWLGLDWNEGPYFQSRRQERHYEIGEKLLESGYAYRDFAPSDASPAEYQQHRALSRSESQRRADSGESFAVRFKVPENEVIRFTDLVYGEITVESSDIEDFVILRSDRSPTYHLGVVGDDADMQISHVIRGADHLSNTGKHVLLFEALGFEVPVFAHLPLILGTDKKRLSKRHGATSVTQYAERGLLPAAVCNYLALLGWSPADDSEILSTEDLLNRFELNRVNKANAVFDSTKLEWLNRRFISSLEADNLEPYVRSELNKAGLWNEEWAREGREWFLGVVDLLKSRVESLSDFSGFGEAFFTDSFEYEEAARDRYLKTEKDGDLMKLVFALKELRVAYANVPGFDLESTEETLRRIADRHEIKTGALIGAVRVATTGKAKAPGIFDVLVTLGRARSVERLDRVIDFLQ